MTFDDNNHIVGASYDAAGDLLADAAGHSYTYDANHRIVSADNGNIQYVYNALGQRVEKIVGGVAKYYLYDPAGRAVTVLDQSGNWLRGEIFAGGRHIATYVNNTTNFDYSDWLGTERLTATVSGTEEDACTSLPYGDDFACSGPGGDPTPLHFTGQQHDAETGLDHFPARDYTSTWAVFTRPDPAPWNLADPQTLDRYVYTADSPVTLTDPTGLTPCAGKSGAACKVKNVVEERHPGSSSTQKPGPWRKFVDRLFGRRPSWNPSQPLPDSPSRLGPDWKRDPSHQDPNGKVFVGPNGEKLEWNNGRPGQPGWRARDHWHWTPAGGRRSGHLAPGAVLRRVSRAAAAAAALESILGSAPEWAPFVLAF